MLLIERSPLGFATSSLTALGILLCAPLARAQTVQEPGVSCDSAALQAADHANVRALRGALAVLQTCGRHAPPVIVALWSDPPADSLSIEALAGTTGAVRDLRVLAAVGAAARNGPTAHVRRAALTALVSLYDPGLSIAFFTRRTPDGQDIVEAAFGRLSHARGTVAGEQSLGSDSATRRDIESLLSDLAASAPQADTRRFSSTLLRGIRRTH